MKLISELKEEVVDLGNMVDALMLHLTLQFPKSQSNTPFFIIVQVRLQFLQI
jgi:hypothetical protein